MSDPVMVSDTTMPGPMDTDDDDWDKGESESRTKKSASSSFILADPFAEVDDQPDTSESVWVMTEHNIFRVIWSIFTAVLLLYLATFYLYHFSFHTFHIQLDKDVHDDDIANGKAPFWQVMDVIGEVTFIIDIIVNFFESYIDSRGIEVVCLRKVAKKYLRSFFFWDFLACIPESAIVAIVKLCVDEGSGEPQGVEGIRLLKLQRLQRLMKLMRLTRIVRCVMSKKNSAFWKWFENFRGIRIIKFLCGLGWTMHLLACGLYITAALHSSPENTWVARRTVNASGDMLVNQPAFEQWLHAMYFVMTVFTTVGFGDMSAGTEAEIIYVAIVMVVGAVVHSIVISEVITIVTSTDKLQEFKEGKFKVVEAFAAHTHLKDDMVDEMKAVITHRAKHLMDNSQDKTQMAHLITGRIFPRWFVGTLPDVLFRGQLQKNRFVTLAQELTPSRDFVPPTMVCLLAIHLNQCEYEAGEIVFHKLDYPFHLHLVLKGSFAAVAIPSTTGGIDTAALDPRSADDNKIESGHGSFKKSQPVTVQGSMRKAFYMPGTSITEQERTTQAYPYRTYSFNNYFGDFELLPGKPRPRASTVRCESAHGCCLALPRDAFLSVIDRFPQYESPWVVLGREREWFRKRLRKQLSHGLPLRSLSALRIQRHWRVARTRLRNRQRCSDSPRNEAPSGLEVLLRMRPPDASDQAPNAAADTGATTTCARNGQCCRDVNVLRRDITELKDTMQLMVREVASLSRTLQSMRNESASNKTAGTAMM